MNPLVCPKCGSDMRAYERNGVTIDQCTGCRGIFLDRGELEKLTDAEAAYYGSRRHPPHRHPHPPATPRTTGTATTGTAVATATTTTRRRRSAASWTTCSTEPGCQTLTAGWAHGRAGSGRGAGSGPARCTGRRGSWTGRGTCPRARRAAAPPDTIFRISSVTKPVVAALAMQLVDDGLLSPGRPRGPAAAGARRPARAADPDSPIDDTVPADRPITVRDVLEFRLGLGMDFTGPFPGTVLGALAERGLPVGPPAPQAAPAPDEWMRIVGSVPLVPPARRAVALQHGRAGARGARRAGGGPPCRSCWPSGCSARWACRTPASTCRPTGSGGSAGSGSGPRCTTSPTGSGRAARFPDAGSGLVSTVDGPARVRGSAARRPTRPPGWRRWSPRGAHDRRGEDWGLGHRRRGRRPPDGGMPGATGGTAGWGRRGGRTR